MIKWSPDKGWYDTNTGLALNSPEEEKRQKEYLEDRNKFLEENMYDPKKDYSGDFGNLFGSSVDESSELYYSGPNPRWQGALSDRLRERMGQKKNVYSSSGNYEGRTGTVDRDLQRQMYRRNNAIEDMFRKGYSTDQILAHTEGKRNVLEEGPDYKDYEKAKAGQKVYGMKGRKDWADDYFDVPKEVQTQAGTEGSDQTGAGTDSGIASINGAGAGAGAGEGNAMPDFTQYIQPFNQNIPAGPGGKGGAGAGAGAGAVGGKGGRRPQQASPFQSQTRRSGMYSSSPAGLGTGYYGGMGSGRRQFGDASYFGGFGSQRPQPSYGGKGGGMPQQPMYGGFGQAYQQPSYSSFGGLGGSGGGIGGFYQPMGYGGYR
tara:strand:+ start:735 stop:1853 length:1119 start_codon:yes stop_codon:yes gene_type:complete